MNKPTVTVTPDDGCSINKMCVRESGTVASNVTAHRTLNPALYHAIERIAEMEAERADLERQVIELREQNAALAAHVEQLSRVFLQGFESSEDHDLDAWEEDAKEVFARQPRVSLAQRDRRIKAEALQELIDRVAEGWDYTARAEAIELRDEYRQQAEEN